MITHDLLWCCPVCCHPLQRRERQAICENGHGFDTAKEGYLNLLLSHHKRSHNPGDDRMMSRSRRAFLEAGHYDPLITKLAEIIADQLRTSQQQEIRLLDLGCGEGYYTRCLQNSLSKLLADRTLRTLGIDISKEAIRLAARRSKAIDFAVASNHRIPLLDDTVDIIITVFAPIDPTQIARVLEPGGLFLNVHPGQQHLRQLRAMIYDRSHPHNPQAPIVDSLQLNQRYSLTFPVSLAEGETADLLAMTPYYWQANQEQQQQIQRLECLETTADFIIDRYRPVVT